MQKLQHKMAALLAGLLAAVALGGCASGLPDTPPPKEEIPTQVLGTVLQEFVYVDANGYFVPTARRVARTEDSTALMRRLLNTEANAAFFADTGLSSALPDGFDLTATVASGLATVDVVGAWQLLDAEQEKQMVRSVVSTALGLPGATMAQLTFNGQTLDTLQNHTPVDGVFHKINLNVDTTVYNDVASGTPVMVYFACQEGLLVPVARYLQNPPTLQVALSQLCQGPSAGSKLQSVLPSGTVVRYASLQDGVATVDFSAPFATAMAAQDGGAAALRAVMLTCQQFEGVQSVQLQVEGAPLEQTDWNMATVTFANEF